MNQVFQVLEELISQKREYQPFFAVGAITETNCRLHQLFHDKRDMLSFEENKGPILEEHTC